MGCTIRRLVDENNNLDTAPSEGPLESLNTMSSAKSTEPETVSVSSYSLPDLSKTEDGFLIPKPPPECNLPDHVMPVTELYNLMNAGYRQASIHDPYNLLIIDCRDEILFRESHIATANHITDFDENFDNVKSMGPVTRYNIFIVYGASDADKKAVEVYETMSSKDIYIQLLEGGFDKFFALCPFLCSDIIYNSEFDRMKTLKTYPSLVLRGALYQGNALQAERREVIQNLGITHVVNISTEVDCCFPKDCKYLHLRYADENGEKILPIFHEVADFIAEAIRGRGIVLVHCVMGVSRSSSVTIAFLMKYLGMKFHAAHDFLKDRRSVIAPNMGFTRQLCKFEKMLFGEQFTEEEAILFGKLGRY